MVGQHLVNLWSTEFTKTKTYQQIKIFDFENLRRDGLALPSGGVKNDFQQSVVGLGFGCSNQNLNLPSLFSVKTISVNWKLVCQYAITTLQQLLLESYVRLFSKSLMTSICCWS
jgi:hypothetical protein